MGLRRPLPVWGLDIGELVKGRVSGCGRGKGCVNVNVNVKKSECKRDGWLERRRTGVVEVMSGGRAEWEDGD